MGGKTDTKFSLGLSKLHSLCKLKSVQSGTIWQSKQIMVLIALFLSNVQPTELSKEPCEPLFPCEFDGSSSQQDQVVSQY